MYQEYAELKNQIAILEEKRVELADKIVNDMKASQLESFPTEHGTFVRAKKKSWKYSPKITKLEEDLKMKKSDEQGNGTAKMEINEYLTFKPNE